jgi:hypothetical protein
MPDYQQGRIYKLVSPHTDQVYVDSTCEKYLTDRKSGHKTDFKRWKVGKRKKVKSFELFELGEDDVDIILLEYYPCNSKSELHAPYSCHSSFCCF